jgi:hypothetical protein
MTGLIYGSEELALDILGCLRKGELIQDIVRWFDKHDEGNTERDTISRN